MRMCVCHTRVPVCIRLLERVACCVCMSTLALVRAYFRTFAHMHTHMCVRLLCNERDG